MSIDNRLDQVWVAPARHEYELGARPTPVGTLFRTWTTQAERVAVVLYDEAGQVVAEHPMAEREPGLFEALVPDVGPGARYKFKLGDDVYPDPYARWLPDGPHGAAAVWRNDYRWVHPAPLVPREKLVIYELHVGAFTPEGTFAAAREKLPYLAELGVTAIELMPIASFPGQRGWGYDGVAAFAPFAGYGTPEELCAFVDEAHGLGLAVILDVVFNHFGPDGNYLYAYAPSYFTDRFQTPWGDAPDYRNPYMRRLALDAAAHWLGELRFDGLRLDATHAIVDVGEPHLLSELVALAKGMPQQALLIAEDDRNDPALVSQVGLDAVWADDFHHHVHVLLTGERDGYYAGYEASAADLARTIQNGWFYEGQAWPLTGKPRGKAATGLAPASFVYCLQNHDQVGNRAAGDRLPTDHRWRALSTLLAFLPMTPLLFMGQEFGARTPFPFFADHAGDLGQAVTEGRRKEFGFAGEVPDPQADATFQAAKLDWDAVDPETLDFTRGLLRLRREDPVLAGDPSMPEAGAVGNVLWVRRRLGDEERLLLLNFGPEAVSMDDLGVTAQARVLVGASDRKLASWEAVVLAAPRALSGVPVATYRLQLHQGFPFQAAGDLLPYLQTLGVSDVYTSPYLRAEAGSQHGYNVASHAEINPELGGEGDYRAFTDRLRLRGLGHVLDTVPNHMGIADGTNAWWRDVLENGPASQFADFFDIEWQTGTPGLDHKVLLPILGDQYGNVLERGELRLEREGGSFWIRYWDKRLPVAPETLIPLLERIPLEGDDPHRAELGSILLALRHLPPQTAMDAEARAVRALEVAVFKRRIEALCHEANEVCQTLELLIEELNGKPGDPASFDALDALLRDQPYRLSFWRVATEEINYRRFFDINELAALRMERPEVFEASHRLIMRFLAEGRVTGLRLDHTDGLYDPLGYFQALHAAAGKPLYLLAEKILEPGEHLPTRWPIHGTTGYDFLALVGGLWVDPRFEAEVTATYQRFTGLKESYAELLYRSKQLIMRTSLSSEVNVLAHQLERLSEGNRRARDFTLASLTTAIVETIAAFPVYRTYIREDGTREAHDDQHVETAIRRAKRRNPSMSASVFDFLRDTLLLRFPDNATPEQREAQVKFALKFQQVTSPVMAKGAEDTAFYNYNRLACLNEVGSDPGHFGTPVAAFHAANAERLRDWPAALLTTATHDHKRGEDTRARQAVLAEAQGPWREALAAWGRLAKGKRTAQEGEVAPSRNDEYLFYQTVLGAWPVDGQLGGFAERIQAYMAKATKEAKAHTSWVNPDPAYDEAVERFVTGMLADARFRRSVAELSDAIGVHGASNGLAQLLLKLTAPGVPDVYQGTELWDQSLVDPDNRRPVDYALRQALLGERRTPEALVEGWRDGAIKLFVLKTALAARQADPELFRIGDYRPIPGDEHVVGFARELEGRSVVVLVPRLTWTLTGGAAGFALGEAWGDRQVALPGRYRNLFTGEALEGGALAQVFARFPVALLVST